MTSTSIEEITGFTETSNHPGLLGVAFGPGTIVDINLENLSVDNVTSYSSGALLISGFGSALNTNISGYDYRYSKGVYTTDYQDFPRYGIESINDASSVNHVKMEYSRITGASGPGYVAFDPCNPLDPFDPCDNPHPGSIVDLGGGPLGSAGQNSIYGNGIQTDLSQGVIGGFDLLAFNAFIHAENNWWGTSDPAEIAARMLPGGFGWGGDIDYTPFLVEDPKDG